MTFVKHRACGTELIWRRVTGYQEMPPLMLWCPACQRVVEEHEADRRGPFVAVTMKQEESMTTNRQFADHEGDFGDWQPSDRTCSRRDEDGAPCGKSMRMRTWESSDGAYEDYQFKCEDGHVEWVDGIDS